MLTNNVAILGPWVWEQTGGGLWHSVERTGMGELDDDGNPLWAAIYEDYHPRASVRLNIAISDPKLVTRRAIGAVFEYPFHQLAVKKVFGHVCSSNVASLDFCRRLGFLVEAVVQDVYRTGDQYILAMTRDQCRWLRGARHGQTR